MEVLDILNNLNSGKIDMKYAQLLLEDEVEEEKTLEGQYKINFNSSDDYVKDHIVNGEKILLGVTYIGSTLNLLKDKGYYFDNIQLKNIILKKAIILDEGKTAEICTSVEDEGKSIRVYNSLNEEAASMDIKKNSEVYPRSKLDFSNIKHKKILSGESIYSLDNELKIIHGKSLRTIDEIIVLNDKECISKLSLKNTEERFKKWPIHPAFIEAASMSWIHIVPKDVLKTFIPLSIKSVDIFDFLASDNAYSKVEVVKVKKDLIELNIDLYDENKVPVLKLNGFVLKYFGKSNNNEKKHNFKIDEEIKRYILNHIIKIGNLDEKEIDLSKNFMEIGLDSIKLLELAKKIEQEIGIELYPTLFFEYENVEELTDYFLKEHKNNFSEYLSKGLSENIKDHAFEGDINSEISNYIAEKIIKVNPSLKEAIDFEKNFMEIGLDSVQLLDLSKDIEKEIGIELYPTLFFEYQNVMELTEYFLENHKEEFKKYFNFEEDSRSDFNLENNYEIEDTEFKETLDNEDYEADEDIAIIGIGGMLPESSNINEFWNNMLQKKDMIKEIPKDHFDYKKWYDERIQYPDKLYCKYGSFIKDVDKFDAKFFGVSKIEAEVMDPQLRKLLEVTHNALEDSGYINKIKGSNTGYYVGTCFHDYLYELLKSGRRVGPYDGTGNAATMLSNYPSFYYDLKGPSISVDTACSSSLVALHLACTAINNKECDMAIVTGVNLLLSPWHYVYFSSTGALSKSGRCHTFDSKADGYVPGEAVAAFVIKPLKKAKEDKDNIYAVIKGSAVNHGGHASNITAPNIKRETEVICKAWNKAGINPDRINFIETHGTGTKLGDPIEVEAIKSTFKKLNRSNNKCFISSAKASIGHTEGAAGLVGILRVILAMKSNIIPAMPKYEEMNPLINIKDTPLVINKEATFWERVNDEPRAAGVSAFGIGGTYAHVVIEEYNNDASKAEENTLPEIITLSAKNKESLNKQVQNLYDYLSENEDISLSDVSYTLNTGRENYNERIAIIADNMKDLLSKLKIILLKEDRNNEDICLGNAQKEYAKSFVKSNDLKELIEKWTVGYLIDWSKYYEGREGRIISLPTYSFDEKLYWAKEVVRNLDEEDRADNIVNTIVGNSYDVKDNIAEFDVKLDGNEFYLNEHKLHGEKVLVGAAFIEMSLEALNVIRSKENFKLRNIQWYRTISFKEDKKNFKLRIDKEKKVITILSKDLNITYFKAEFEENLDEGHRIDIPNKNEAKYKFSGMKKNEDIYRNFESLGLNLGKSFRVVEEFYYNDENAVSFINSSLDANLYKMHPALLDGSFHGVSAFFLDEKESINVPFSVGEVKLFNDFEKSMVVFLKRTKKNINSHINTFDIDIYSTNGKAIASIRDFSARKILKKDVETQKESKEIETTYITSIVKETDSLQRNSDIWKRGVLVFSETHDFDKRLIYEKYDTDLIVIVNKGKEFRKIKNNHYEINPHSKEDYKLLWQDIKNDLVNITSIIYFAREVKNFNKDNLISEYLEKGPLEYMYICQTISKFKLNNNLNIYYLYHFKDEDEDIIHEALLSMSKSIKRENKKLRLKIIGYDEGVGNKDLYNILDSESQTEDLDVVYKENKRYKRVFVPLKDDKKIVSNIKEGSVILITGGNGTIGFEMAKYFAKNYKAKLVLIGRRIIDDISRVYEEIKSLGGECIYYRADVCKADDMKRIIEKAKLNFGSIDGIIHCAGIIKDRSFMFKDIEEVDEVLAPKIYGSMILDSITKNENLSFFITISSVSAVIGSVGQCDYAYANSFMDKFCEYRNKKVLMGDRAGHSLSINYSFWKDGGMKLPKEVLEKYEAELGLLPISKEIALKTLEYGLSKKVNHICVMRGVPSKMKTSLNDIKWSDKEYIVPISKGVNRRMKVTENLLKEELRNILTNLAKEDDVDIRDDIKIEEYGINSIGYAEFANEVNEKLNIDISPAIFFSNPSIAELAKEIIKEYPSIFEDIKETDKEEKLLDYDMTLKEDNYYEEAVPIVNKKDSVNLNTDVAIIGMDCVFPGAKDADSFWENLRSGKESIVEIPKSRWDFRDYLEDSDSVKWGGFIEDVDVFDNKFFKVTPREAEQMDPQQRLFLKMVWRSIEDSGHSPKELSGKNVGVFVGASSYDYMDLMRTNNNEVEAYTSLGNSHSMIANRVSYFLNLHGPSEAIDTACSSSLVAISRAVELLKNGDCEYAIAGGINLMLSPTLHQSFEKAGMLSKKGHCSTCDKDADGYVRGEGGGVVLLKPLDKAIRDKDNIYAVIKGTSVNHGGRANFITAPNPDAQAELITSCYEKAGIDFSTIKYIETHGTGTSLGDAVEIAGLNKAYKNSLSKHNKVYGEDSKCLIGSVKTNIGHLEAASGMASLIKSILILKNEEIVPHLNVKEINPNLNLEKSHFAIVNKLTSWKAHYETPRRIGISSFGFGGTNAHLILEDYKNSFDKRFDENRDKTHIFTFSSMSEESLKEYMKEFDSFLENEGSNYTLEEIECSLHRVRSDMDIRLAIIASSREELKRKISLVIEKGFYTKGIYFGKVDGEDKIADILSGDAGEIFIRQLLKDEEYEKIAVLWIRGINVKWIDSNKIRHISLPKYVFEKQRFWGIKKKEIDKNISKDIGKIVEVEEVKEVIEVTDIKETSEDIEIEDYLKKTIAEIIKIDVKDIHEDEVFAEMGLDSILSMELLQKIREKYGIRLFPNELLINPTIKGVRGLIEESLKETKGEDLKEDLNIEEKLPEKSKKVVYVFSSPRSGSTLFRTMLMGNSEMFAPSELMLLPYDNLKEWDEDLNSKKWVHFKDGLIQTIKVLKNISADEAVAEVKDMVKNEVKISEVYKMLQALASEKYFVDKTPPYSESVDILKKAEETTPNALYIYLHRNPLSVMESLVRNRFHKLLNVNEEPWKFADEAWRNANENIINFLDTVDDSRKIEVAYEDLVASPKEEMERICNWLGIEYEDSMINPYEGDKMRDGLRENSMPVGDPNFLTHKKIEPELALAWKKNIKYVEKLSNETKSLAEKLGYVFEEGLEVYSPYKLGPSQKGFINYIREYDETIQFTMVQSGEISLKEKLDLKKMNKAIENLVKAHPVLTNKFFIKDGEWYQGPSEYNTIPVKVIDGTTWDKDEFNDKRQYLIDERLKEIDIFKGKLISMIALKKDDLVYEFTLIIHHFVCDAVSSGVIWKELFERYNGKISDSNFVDTGYEEYINNLDKIMKSTVYKGSLKAWKEAIPVKDIKKIKLTNNTQADRREKREILNFRDIGDIKDKSRIFHIVGAALYLAVQEVTEDSNVCIAHMLGQRNLPMKRNVNEIVGCFVDDIPIYINVDSNKEYSEIINEFKKKFSKFSSISSSYGVLASKGKLPDVYKLCNVRLNYQPYRLNELGFNAWSTDLHVAPNLPHKYVYNCIVQELEDGLRFEVRYSGKHMKTEEVQGFIDRWISLIKKIYIESSEEL